MSSLTILVNNIYTFNITFGENMVNYTYENDWFYVEVEGFNGLPGVIHSENIEGVHSFLGDGDSMT
jgi:hypothetical protein